MFPASHVESTTPHMLAVILLGLLAGANGHAERFW